MNKLDRFERGEEKHTRWTWMDLVPMDERKDYLEGEKLFVGLEMDEWMRIPDDRFLDKEIARLEIRKKRTAYLRYYLLKKIDAKNKAEKEED